MRGSLVKDKVFFHKQGKERDLRVLALIYFMRQTKNKGVSELRLCFSQ